MSEIVIILLLLAPVLLVAIILNNSRKKQRKKTQDKLSVYLSDITDKHGMEHGFQKQLVHQMVSIDEDSRKILIVDHRDHDLSHHLYPLDSIKTLRVVNLTQTLPPDDRNKKAEVITTQIGVEIVFEKPDKEIFIVFYDHIEHNIFQMAELEKEARQLHERITKTKIRQPINA